MSPNKNCHEQIKAGYGARDLFAPIVSALFMAFADVPIHVREVELLQTRDMLREPDPCTQTRFLSALQVA